MRALSKCSTVARGVARRLLFVMLLFVAAAGSSAWALTEVTGFGSNPGNLQMFKYVPAGLPQGAPLVVALHGCSQGAANYDDETGWVLLADRWKFALLLPQQQSSNNSTRCFNWFEAGDIARGQGEALSIKQMIDRMGTDHGIASTRVYVTGLSAGGGFVAVMLATYPEVFAGGAIVAGIPYNCGTGLTNAFSCMNPGSDLSPTAWANKVRAATSYTGPWPIVSIWHGDADTTVRPANLTEAMEQWTAVHGIDQTPEVSDTVAGVPHRVYKNGAGKALVETWLVPGMGHGTPVDPGAGATQCGAAGAFILDVDVCSSYYIARFFGLDNTDAVAPTVAISAPANNAVVSGLLNVTMAASDNVGVARVELLADGVLIGTDTSAPFAIAWDLASVANGDHVLQARAFDAAGNSASSAPVAIVVTGGIEDTTPPMVNLTFPTSGARIAGTVELSARASDDVGVASVQFFANGVVLGSATRGAEAGPWTLSWNTTALTDGNYALRVEARDARGNLGIDDDTTVIITHDLPVVDEHFSDLDADGDVFDDNGWAGDFVADNDNATAGAGGSRSVLGAASSGTGCATGLKTKSLTRSVTLGASPRLSYQRRLDLRATANTSTTARFRVYLDTTVIDEKTVTFASYADAVWQAREAIDLAAFANRTATLKFEVAANANVCVEAYAKAWIDDVRIANADSATDVTPPTVNLTAPSAGASVSGVVDLAASASDAVGVNKVEFYVDGSLLGTDLSAPYGLPWDSTTVANGTHALSARAYDAAGNVGVDNDTAVTVNNGGTGGTTVVTFYSEAANDGYVKANADGSGAAIGTLESSLGVAAGRGTDGKFNRAVFSFDTSSLPDGATIVSAVLTVTYNSASGDPWSSPAGNTLTIDLRNGCFGGCALEASDYGAAASASNVATIARFTGGTQNSTPFSGAGVAAISKTARTQARIGFAQTQTATNYIWLGSGANASLRVEYQP